MADTNTTDVRTMTVKAAAEDAELWEAVARGEYEVIDGDGDVMLSVKSTAGGVAGCYVNTKVGERWFLYDDVDLLTVRRVQPSDDDVRLYAEAPNANELSERELGQLFVQQAVADLADFLLPPTDAEVITFLSAQCNLLQRLYDDKGAQLAEAIGALERISASVPSEELALSKYLRAGEDSYEFGRWDAAKSAREALAALRADSEHDSAERSL